MLGLMFVIFLQKWLSTQNSSLIPKAEMCYHGNPSGFVGAQWLLHVELSLQYCLFIFKNDKPQTVGAK